MNTHPPAPVPEAAGAVEAGLIEHLVGRYGALSEGTMDIYNATISRAMRAETERCAKVALSVPIPECGPQENHGRTMQSLAIAAAIRAPAAGLQEEGEKR